MGKKNYGKSVKTRLLNLMNETGYKYMYLLARYFNERLLYRVSVSQYKDNFLLKGGSLLYAMNGLEARPTVDVDFMADRISRDRDFLAQVFQEILGIVCDEDGVSFDVDSIKLEPITIERETCLMIHYMMRLRRLLTIEFFHTIPNYSYSQIALQQTRHEKIAGKHS